MATEQETELQHNLEMRDILRERIKVLEKQAIQFGWHAAAHIKTELKEARKELEDIEAKIRPPETPAFLERMSADEQRRYLVALVMGLQADFVACRIKLSRRIAWLMGAVLGFQVLLTVLVVWRLS